jgi:hypothetical protein
MPRRFFNCIRLRLCQTGYEHTRRTALTSGNSQRDRAAMATRFVIPLVVNGRVYFGARGEVEVYGLLQ